MVEYPTSSHVLVKTRGSRQIPILADAAGCLQLSLYKTTTLGFAKTALKWFHSRDYTVYVWIIKYFNIKAFQIKTINGVCAKVILLQYRRI